MSKQKFKYGLLVTGLYTLVTRRGDKAVILVESEDFNQGYPLIGYISPKDGPNYLASWDIRGLHRGPDSNDLFLVPKQVTKWINLDARGESHAFDSEKAALESTACNWVVKAHPITYTE